VVEEKIYHDAGAKTSEFTPRGELERLIRAAGRVPVERDTLYHPVDRSKLPPIPAAPPKGLVSLTLNV
jgi:aminodeoxyfutalosine synthase